MLQLKSPVLLVIYLYTFSYIDIFAFGCPQHEVEGKADNFNTVSNDMKVICYYGSWSVYRPGNGKFPVEEIDPFLCSHLIYSFTGLGHDNRIRPLDPYNDLKENYGKGAFVRFNSLKNINKNLKTLIAIGGWNEGSIKYSNMASKPETRKIFAESVVQFLDKYGFDGLDLDWEYPAARGGKPEDKQNFVALLKDLKEALSPRGYILSAAVSAGKWYIDPAYDIPKVSEYLDIINIMCYDYHGGWENRTGHNSPLYPRPDEVDNDRISNVNFSINYWISRGAPKNKIVLGMGTYGRSFTLQRSENNGLRSDAPQTGQAGPYTREKGSLGYNEICEMRLNNEQWTEVRDPYYLAPYAYKDRQWVGFDDVESITVKAQYIKAMQLAGGMIWSIETDDFRGKCGPKYPLLNAINNVFKSDNVVLPLPKPSEKDKPAAKPAPKPTPKPSTSSSMPTTKPWVWAKPSTTASPISSSSSTPSTSSTPTSSSTWWPQSSSSSSSTWWPQSSSSSSSTWWPQSSVSSSSASSSTSWPWAPTHPTQGSAANTKPEQMTSTTTTTTSATKTSTSNSVDTSDGKEGSNKFHCKSVGIFRNPNNCQKFYRCVPTVREGMFTLYDYKCPDKTVFNGETSLCDWVENVPQCKNSVPQHFFRDSVRNLNN